MTESVDRQTAVLRLRGADDILILCHKNPDGDTIGCAGALYLALKALGKNAAILCSDPIPKMYDYMELRWFDGSFNPAFVVAVDVASIQLFGENNNVPQYAAHTNLCIDHHASNSGYAYETLLDPGFIMNALALFREKPDPNEEEIKEYLAGNLCRCSGYEGQLRGIQNFLAWKKSKEAAQ